jgi:hypothetical protein
MCNIEDDPKGAPGGMFFQDRYRNRPDHEPNLEETKTSSKATIERR